MAEKKSRLSKLLSLGHSRSQSPKETSSAKSTKKNLFSIRSRSPHPEPTRDNGKAVQIDPIRVKDEPSMEPKAEKSNEEEPQLVGGDPKTKRDDDKSNAAFLPESIERGRYILGAD
jgi:hypothetical protein